MRIVEFIDRSPEYTSVNDLARITGVSKRTIQRRLDELEKLTERYGHHAVIRDDGIVLANYIAFIDYLRYRQQIKRAPKSVPDYNPTAIKRRLGDEAIVQVGGE